MTNLDSHNGSTTDAPREPQRTEPAHNTLTIILGDQLDVESPLIKKGGRFWMAEVMEESTHVWSHKARTALFLAAMRHFADSLSKIGELHYDRLGEHPHHGLGEALSAFLQRNPEIEFAQVLRPGDFRVLKLLQQHCAANEVVLKVVEDPHFYITPAEFRQWAEPRKSLRMEYFYRDMRKHFAVMMKGDKPLGGQWNFDKENRGSFGKQGPTLLPEVLTHHIDDITQSALDDTEKYFGDHPGSLDKFNWPVTRQQALTALQHFVQHRLHDFGHYQDAMWTGEPTLFHSLLSAAMNMKLLHPQEVVAAAVAGLDEGAPMNAVEGFVRQIIGWREYVRGVYWYNMPNYKTDNHFDADFPLPNFYWTGDTEYNCLSEVIGQTLETGYAHHIQRLMVTGLFSLLLGVKPNAIHEWYLAVYVDAVEWVEVPNTLGMSQYADGGLMSAKPYIASGKYIQRMSNYCEGCKHNPANSTGEDACPFTTLYWDFLLRHEEEFAHHPMLALQVRNARKIPAEKQQAIRTHAIGVRKNLIEENSCSTVS